MKNLVAYFAPLPFNQPNAILSQLPDKDKRYPIHLPRLPPPPLHHHRRHDNHQHDQHPMTPGIVISIIITASIIFSIIAVAEIVTFKFRFATLTSISGTLLLN